jgi:hypothetical protein
MVDAAVLNKPATPPPPPPSQTTAPAAPTFTLAEICEDELRADISIAHSRAIVTAESTDSGTEDFLNAVADTFEARGNLNPKAKQAWTDLAGAIKGVAELVGYMDFDHRI